MWNDFRNSVRLLKMAVTLAQHDALFPLDATRAAPLISLFTRLVPKKSNLPERPGKRLAKALEALGPTFIKLGQMLSTRADIVGEEVAEDLASLRDRLPPFPTAQAEATIERELRRPLTELFAHFEATPIAAASIAQVHFATLPDGTPVAVKVLRPGIQAHFARDIALCEWLAARAERRMNARHRPREVVDVFRKMVMFEMDLRLEAAAAAELRENLLNDKTITVPAIYWNHTAGSVLTMERISGISINDVTALKAAGHNLDTLLERMANAFFTMVFRDGFFHADLHPGNIFVEPSGRIAVVDFGIMGRISEKDRRVVAEILHGFLTGDWLRLAQIHFDAGYVPANQSVEQFALACRAIAKPILDKPLHEVSVGLLLGQLMAIAENFQMITQPQLLLLQKTMVMVEGIGRMLNPQVNMWKMAEPLIKQWAQDNFGLRSRARQTGKELFDAARALPEVLLELRQAINTLPRALKEMQSTNAARDAYPPRQHWGWALLWALAGAVIALNIRNL